MVMPPYRRTYYINHENPHHISYTTFLHRIKLCKKPDGTKRTMEEALRIPYFGRGGDRKNKQYRIKIKLLRFVDPNTI